MSTDFAADTATLDGLIAAFYDGVSGPAGRLWNRQRERNLYLPGARLVRLGPGADGRPAARVMTLEEFMDGTAEFFAREGFYEREIARRVDRFGSMAHVFSTYEARHRESDPAPFKRGINSLQLFWDGDRWWITAALWMDESPASPLPERYLKAGEG